jgi:hypothetical protein
MRTPGSGAPADSGGEPTRAAAARGRRTGATTTTGVDRSTFFRDRRERSRIQIGARSRSHERHLFLPGTISSLRCAAAASSQRPAADLSLDIAIDTMEFGGHAVLDLVRVVDLRVRTILWTSWMDGWQLVQSRWLLLARPLRLRTNCSSGRQGVRNGAHRNSSLWPSGPA